MTRRTGWLLLNLAWALAILPGCALFRSGQSDPEPCRHKHGTVVPAKAVADAKEKPGFSAASAPDEIKKSTVGSAPVEQKVPVVRTTSGSMYPAPGPVDVPPPAAPAKSPQAPPAAAAAEPGGKTPASAVTASAKAKKRSPLVEALQCMLDDRHQEALHHLQAYDRDTQEFFLGILPTLTLIDKKRLHDLSTPEVAVLNEQLQSLLITLRPKTKLTIDKMCYCDEITGYGLYRPRADRPFQASTPARTGDMVQLYVELRNFVSEQTADGLYETRLSSTVEVRDAKGELAYHHPFKDEPPLSTRTRRSDLYNTYLFPVPVLPPGNYQLVIQIVDETIPEARRVDRKALDFRVTGPAAR